MHLFICKRLKYGGFVIYIVIKFQLLDDMNFFFILHAVIEAVTPDREASVLHPLFCPLAVFVWSGGNVIDLVSVLVQLLQCLYRSGTSRAVRIVDFFYLPFSPC